jgi:hypothetical protein
VSSSDSQFCHDFIIKDSIAKARTFPSRLALEVVGVEKWKSADDVR